MIAVMHVIIVKPSTSSIHEYVYMHISEVTAIKIQLITESTTCIGFNSKSSYSASE